MHTYIHTHFKPTLADYCSIFCCPTRDSVTVLALQKIGLRSLAGYTTDQVWETTLTKSEGASGHSNCT